jgi:hypothetical protein
MELLAKLRARLTPADAAEGAETPPAPPAVPPRCFACRQDVIPLEALGGDRWFCVVCAHDFAAVLEDHGATWRVDRTPVRYARRRRVSS